MTDKIIEQLNAEISKLTQARNVLLNASSFGKRMGPPRGRHLSAATRRRIADGMRKRWAARKKEDAAN